MRCLLGVSVLFMVLLASMTNAHSAVRKAAREVHQAHFKKQRDTLKQLQKELKAKHGRGYKAQQSAAEIISFLQPASSAPQCQAEYSTATQMLLGACAATLSSLPTGQQFKNNAEAQTAWTTACSGQCLPQVKTIIGTNLEECMQPSLKTIVKSTVYMCEATSSSGESCGVQISRFDRFNSCDDYNATTTPVTCAQASDVCESYDKGQEVNENGPIDPSSGGLNPAQGKKCRSTWSSSVMQGLCDGGCLEGYLRVMKESNPTDTDLGQARAMIGMLCSKASDNTYCLPKIKPATDAFDAAPAPSKATFAGVCTDSNVLPCYKKVTNAIIPTFRTIGKEWFAQCAKGKTSAEAIKRDCEPTLKVYNYAIKETQQMTAKFCTKNAAGDYCMQKRLELYTNPCFQQARMTELPYMQCPANCSAPLKEIMAGLGCCAGTIQDFYSKASKMEAKDIPAIPGDIGSQYKPTTTTDELTTTAPVVLNENEEASNPGKGFLATFGNCGVEGINNTLSKKCKAATKSIKKRLGLKILWAKLQANPAAMAALKASLKTDMATNLGVAESEIINDEIVRNPSIQVTTTGTAAARRQETGDGIAYDFEINAETEESTDAAGATFDNSQSQNSFQLASSTETVQATCTDCTSADGELAEPAPAPGSGGAATQVLGVVAALVAIVSVM